MQNLVCRMIWGREVIRLVSIVGLGVGGRGRKGLGGHLGSKDSCRVSTQEVEEQRLARRNADI